MKYPLAARMRLSALITAGALGFSALVTPHLVVAQSAPEKIRLMADTLRARDSGSMDLAKEKAEELIKIAPNDENVQRLLASINRELDRRTGPISPTVYGQASPAVNGQASAADAALAEASADQDAKIAGAENAIVDAQKLTKLGAYGEASNLLKVASSNLTLNTATSDTIEAIEAAKTQIVIAEAKALADSGDAKGAKVMVEQYRAAGGDVGGASRRLASQLDNLVTDPYKLNINDISPKYVAQGKIIRDLLTRGRAQYLNGDFGGAAATFKEVEARDANNPDAKLYQTKIAEVLGGIHGQNIYKTREQMLTEVDRSWERPKVFDIKTGGPEVVVNPGLQDKLNSIIIPEISFSGTELTDVIKTLSEASVQYDPERMGINIVPLFDSNRDNPRVNISLRNLNMDRVLQFVTQQVNFAYDVGADAVTISPDGASSDVNTVTEFFPISRATVIRLTGVRDSNASPDDNPFETISAPASPGSTADDTRKKLQDFFQSAGVNFGKDLPGVSLAYDDVRLIVTQTRRNLERMRAILRNYNEVQQVEIEAKFLEVSQNDLEEVGFDWSVGEGKQSILDGQGFSVLDIYGNPTYDTKRKFTTQARNLSNTFSTGVSDSAITVQAPGANTQLFPNSPPSLNSAIDLAADATNLFTSLGWSVNGSDVNFALRALSRKTGTDLMSAPKVTVLSGKQAAITVGQEFLYPTSYGEIQSEVSQGSSGNGNGGGGASSISITAATPEEFESENIGVEMVVTPTVQSDDTINLRLQPKVTEFEGFVEYGGPSVALGADGTVVTVPAGFYQPIFSTRRIDTEVTVFDGATLVMGGLTRDEVKTVSDKVPLLGDIPGLGRLFRSEGETRQKRNLLIFVTANLVSPGGSPARQNYRNVNANSMFQNPTIMTPSGAVNRSIEAVSGE
jgi:general secretion pathway protein D